MSQKIFSIRKGSSQWNEDDRLQMAAMLVKCGYAVRIGRRPIQGKEGKNAPCEYFVEYWEMNGGSVNE